MSQAWIDEMAASWFAKAQEGMSASEKKAFETWLSSNPTHQKAYASFEQLWRDLDALAPYTHKRSTSKKKMAWIYGACAAAACFVIAFFQWQSFSHRLEFAQSMQTPVGKMTEYSLHDGTTLFLDTNTHVSVAYYADERRVVLHKGQIVLHVRKNKERPLFVEAKNVEVKVTGTRFEVQNHEKSVRVSVEEGSVDVAHQIEKRRVYLASLGANEQIVVDEKGLVLAKKSIQSSTIAPWRNGRLVFDKTPLHEALYAFERYGVKPVQISSIHLASLPLSGSFEIERFSSFIEMLPKVLPLKVIRKEETIRLEE